MRMRNSFALAVVAGALIFAGARPLQLAEAHGLKVVEILPDQKTSYGPKVMYEELPAIPLPEGD